MGPKYFLNWSVSVWIDQSLSELISLCLNWSVSVWIDQSLSELISTCLNWAVFFWTLLDSSQLPHWFPELGTLLIILVKESPRRWRQGKTMTPGTVSGGRLSSGSSCGWPSWRATTTARRWSAGPSSPPSGHHKLSKPNKQTLLPLAPPPLPFPYTILWRCCFKFPCI